MQIYTTTLSSGTLVLNRQDGATIISIQAAVNSSCLFTGNLPFQGNPPTSITLTAGQIFNFAASSPQSPLDGITVTWVSGNVDFVVGV